MSVPWQDASHGRGMLLMRGRPDAVVAWARRGLVPVHVAPLRDWTVVLPAGASRALPPYDDPLTALAGRPISARLRAAVGFFAVNGNAVVTVHPPGWRAIQRWTIWVPHHGVVASAHLASGRPSDLVRAAGTRDRSAQRWVRDLLTDRDGDASQVLTDLLGLLSLPGVGLLDGSQDGVDLAGGRMVEPDVARVARFDATVTDEARQRAELEGL